MQDGQGDRHDAITDLAQRLLTVAEATYEAAPKLMLPGEANPPPPLSWHAAYTGAQFIEPLLRLLVLRKVEIDILKRTIEGLGEAKPPIIVPKGFNGIVDQCGKEANRILQVFNVQLAQEI